MTIRRSRAYSLVVASAAVGLATGAGAFASANDDAPATRTQVSREALRPDVPLVAAPAATGKLSFGTWQQGKPAPDLVEGTTNDGKPGFLRTYDLANLDPTKQKVEANGDLLIPVYAEDGRTIIGQWTAATVTLGESE